MDVLPKDTYTLDEVGLLLHLHIASQEERDKKIDVMYEILVTGNGKPSMRERVNTLEKFAGTIAKVIWIVTTPALLALGAGLGIVVSQNLGK